MNILLDGTLGSRSILKRVDMLTDESKGKKYKVRGVFVDVPVEESVKSAIKRHRDGNDARRRGVKEGDEQFGGRYVPPAVIRHSTPPAGSEHRSTNRSIFADMVDSGVFTNGSLVIDNTGISDRKPLNKIVERDGKVVG